jgi:Protein of unknown function (DUF2946)
MDDLVLQAMRKWPNVPDCYGWLGLDARGEWCLRDAQAQAAGVFGSGQPGSRGAPLRHEALKAFIHRNYACDGMGQWYFQNGPQRVYVELEHAPWVMRLHPGDDVRTHTGQPVQPNACLVDERGFAYLATDQGLGLVHSMDMEALADALEAGRWLIEEVRALDLPHRYGFVRSPARGQAEASGP